MLRCLWHGCVGLRPMNCNGILSIGLRTFLRIFCTWFDAVKYLNLNIQDLHGHNIGFVHLRELNRHIRLFR